MASIVVRPSLRARLAYFGAMYVLQGTIVGYFTIALINHLLTHGVTAERVSGVFAVIGLPWMVAFLWGPVVDRYRGMPLGPRRGWACFGAIGTVLCSALMLTVHEPAETPRLLFALLIGHGICASLLDTAVDALSVSAIPDERERGRLSAVVSIGECLGAGFGSIVLGKLLRDHGFHVAQLAFTLMIAAVTLIILAVPESRLVPSQAQGAMARRATLREIATAVTALLVKPRVVVLLAVVLATEVVSCIASFVMNARFLQQYGVAEAVLTHARGISGMLAGLVVAAVSGFLVDRFGAARVLAMTFGAATVVYAGVAVGAGRADPTVLAVGLEVFYATLGTIVFVASTPLFMRFCAHRYAATQLTFFMCLWNIASVAGTRIAGTLVDYASVSLLTIGVVGCTACLMSVAAVIAYFRGDTVPIVIELPGETVALREATSFSAQPSSPGRY